MVSQPTSAAVPMMESTLAVTGICAACLERPRMSCP